MTDIGLKSQQKTTWQLELAHTICRHKNQVVAEWPTPSGVQGHNDGDIGEPSVYRDYRKKLVMLVEESSRCKPGLKDTLQEDNLREAIVQD